MPSAWVQGAGRGARRPPIISSRAEHAVALEAEPIGSRDVSGGAWQCVIRTAGGSPGRGMTDVARAAPFLCHGAGWAPPLGSVHRRTFAARRFPL